MLNVPELERKFELDTARRIVGELADLIRPACERLEVCGSIRRGTPYVKDADLVAIPDTRVSQTHLHAWLDGMLERGLIEKALYGASKTTRWGPKLRGLMFQGLQIEIDLADEHNWGYKKMLRSGPKSANEYMMGYISWRKPALRLQDGYGWYSPGNLWHKPKDKWVADDKVQLSIPDEETLFALLGMPYLPPNERGEQQYKRLMGNNRQHRWPDFSKYVLKPADAERVRLVNVEPVKVVPEPAKAGSEVARISPFGVTAANADAWAAQVYAETLARTERQLSEARLYAGSYASYARRVAVLEKELAMLRGIVE